MLPLDLRALDGVPNQERARAVRSDAQLQPAVERELVGLRARLVGFDRSEGQERHPGVPCPTGARKILDLDAIGRNHLEQQMPRNLLIGNGFIRPKKSQDVPKNAVKAHC